MIPLIRNQTNIDLVNQLSFSQALRLNIPRVVNRSLDRICDSSKNYETDLGTIAQSLDRIKANLDTYSSVSRIQKFKNVFNGRHFRMCALRRALPGLIRAVSHEAWSLFSLDEKPQIKLSTSKPSTIYDNFQTLKGEGIARKWEVVNQVHQLFLSQNPDPKNWDHTTREVDSFISAKFEILSRGEDTTLPRFFHATKDRYWSQIVTSKKIMRTHAALGFGAYASTKDESHSGYGPYTFALTHRAVYRHPASYYNGGVNTMWVRVEHDIELTPRTVSHFVAESAEKCQDAGIMFNTALGFDVPVITRAANDCLITLFDQVITQRYLPKKWRLMFGHSRNNLPSSIIING